MVSRRAVLAGAVGLGAAGVTLVATDRLDDALRAVGARPKPAPADRDLSLLGRARSDQTALISLAKQTGAPPALVEVLRKQARGLGAQAATPTPGLGESGLSKALAAAVAARRSDAAAARSADVATVLASLSAGLAQVQIELGNQS